MSVPSRVDIADTIEKQEKTWFGYLIFIWCALVMMADGYDNQVINYAAPAISQDLGVSRAAMGPVLTSSIAAG